MDRGKIIKGLETCRTRVHCKECPYAYDKRADDSYCEAVLHNDVLELLKEQEEAIPISWLESFTRLKCMDYVHGIVLDLIKTWKAVKRE